MTGLLHEVSCGYPASREMKRLGKDTQGYVSFPNRPIKWREMPLQAVSAKSILTLAMPAVIALLAALLVHHRIAATLRTQIARNAQMAEAQWT
jgi:hypothetical protein